MDRINSLSRMMELLRRRVSETARGEASKKTARDAPSGAVSGSTQTLETLRALISKRIRALGEDESGREDRATRVFVESVIAWEFGEEILNDPEYEDLIRHIDGQLRADSAVRARFLDIIRQLDARET